MNIVRRMKPSSSAIAVLTALAGAHLAFAGSPALPAGGAFAEGSGSISVSGSTEAVTINGKPSAGPVVINWGSGYDVGAGGTVNYAPGTGGPTAGTVVNVDQSGSVSVIDGTVSSPDFTQVVVNPDGINVGSTAVMPASTELAAGTFSDTNSGANVTISADTAPVTIAKGASFGTPPSAADTPPSIGVTAVSGDTLPDSAGVQPVRVTVPANQSSSFTLQPGQTGSLQFIGPIAPSTFAESAPSSVTVTGPAGGTVGDLVLDEPVQSSTLPSGTLSVSDVTSTGSLELESAQGITLSGDISAADNLTADAAAYRSSAGSTGATLTIAPGTVVDGGDMVNLQGNSVDVSGSFSSDAPLFSIAASMPIKPSAGATVTDATDGAAITVAAPTISNLTISATGSGATATANANTIDNVSISAPTVTLNPAVYEAGAPDYKPMNVAHAVITGGNVFINGAYGVALDNVTQSLPAGTQSGDVVISGANSVGAYQPSTNAVNTVSIGNSVFDIGLGGFMDVQAGVAAGSTTPVIPGSITVDGSTLAGRAGSISASAYDGGTIDVGTGSTLSADAGGACTSALGGCSTEIQASSVDFKAGNGETASGANLLEATSTTGTASTDPAETAPKSRFEAVNVGLYAPGGTVTVAGVLDAGKAPQPVTTGSGDGSSATTTAPPASQPATTTAPPASQPAAAPQPATTPVKTATATQAEAKTAQTVAASTVAPSVAAVSVEPSSSVTTVQQEGATVLVPEGSSQSGTSTVGVTGDASTTAAGGSSSQSSTKTTSRKRH